MKEFHAFSHGGCRPLRQRGALSVVAGLTIAVLIGFAAFAIDLSRLLVVRSELQTVADAAALAGAAYLYPPPTGSSAPNWALAETEAGKAVTLNKSEGVALANNAATRTVASGWWVYSSKTLQASGGTQPTGSSAAVSVTVTRSGSSTPGPMVVALAQLLGIQTLNASATSTAAAGIPLFAGLGGFIPWAISECIVTPGSGGSYPYGNPNPPGSGSNDLFVIGQRESGPKNCNGCSCGQWTSFDTGSDNLPTVRNFLDGTTPSPQMPVPGTTYISPGAKNELWTTSKTLIGKDVIVPIIDDTYDLKDKGLAPLIAIECVRIRDVGTSKNDCDAYNTAPGYENEMGNCFVMSWSNACDMPGTGSGSGAFTGVSVPPRLVR